MKKVDRQGMAIVFAVLLVSLVLTVSLILLNITLRQIVLSIIARDHRLAFYAADSAVHCTRAWDEDRHNDLSGRGAPFGYFEDVLVSGQWITKFREAPPGSATPSCDGRSVTDFSNTRGTSLPTPTETDPYTSEFTIYYSGRSSPACANVEVRKYFSDPSTPSGPTTVILAQGYNLSEPATTCPLVSDRTVEVTWRVVY